MGVNITELLQMQELEFRDLNNKIIAVDASLFLYQFLTTIRQPDGTLLQDSKGNITSHLTGLFYRTIKLMNYGMKLAYVFDGEPPELKRKERDRRRTLKEAAAAKYNIAAEKKDTKEMKKYAARTTRLTKKMVEESKELLNALGVPVVQAPSEAEAQAAYIAKKGDAYGLASQDADSLMFGAPLLIRNLSLIGKRKKVNALSYKTVKPEIIKLHEVLNNLGIDRNQLIVLCMLIGTDYNVGGIRGVGPKNALKLVKQFKGDFENLFKYVKWKDYFDFGWQEVYYQIKKIKVTDDYALKWEPTDEEKVKEILVLRHEFSEERVITTIKKRVKDTEKQKGLGEFF